MKKLFLGLLCAAAAAACGAGSNDGTKTDKTAAPAAGIVPVSKETSDQCKDWNANLAKCAPYRCVLVGAEGNILGRQITGLQNGKCLYTEQVSADKALQCALPLNHMQDMAQYYRETEVLEDVELTVMQLADGSVVYQETISGVPVKTPLQRALAERSCHMKDVRVKQDGSAELTDLQFEKGQDRENISL